MLCWTDNTISIVAKYVHCTFTLYRETHISRSRSPLSLILCKKIGSIFFNPSFWTTAQVKSMLNFGIFIASC